MDQAKTRADYIRRIQAARLLDAVFLLFYYNEWTRRWGPLSERPPALDLSEALPTLSRSTYEHALALANRMWSGATPVSLALLKYPEAKRSYEEELTAFKAENPGFSDESYNLALDAACVIFR
jgi:hypothetical protein